MLWLIRFYQSYISPLKGPTCKYYPTCSEYALQAIQLHGPFRGFALGLWRFLRCNPFSRGGYDPVPVRTGGAARSRGYGECNT